MAAVSQTVITPHAIKISDTVTCGIITKNIAMLLTIQTRKGGEIISVSANKVGIT